MSKNKAMEEERRRLTHQIHEWNANRYDLFAITPPNDENEYFGVMRFFFQEADQRVSTKCIRVSNTASTRDVLNTLVEKFRPDMRMLTLPRYALYEVHVNGEERKLQDDEYPLNVQLNWGQDDREGRFLLKNMDEKTFLPKTDSITNTTEAPASDMPEFKRKLSKREKKELKKKEKEAKMKDKENKSPSGDGVAGKLYNELPDTSFTRSISNPEAVMRKRRQLKLERKLQEIRSKDGGPDQGGTLKIYGESIRPDVPYKTLLLSTNDTCAYVVKETLDKYGMDKEDPKNYCLIQTLLPPDGPEYHGPGWGQKEFILDDDDCPLNILMHTPPNKGTVVFQMKKRPVEMINPAKKRSASATRLDTRERYPSTTTHQDPRLHFPFLVEIAPDGSEPYKAHKFNLLPNGTEVGSEQGIQHSGQYVQLHGPDIAPRHCVFTITEGLVTVTPMHRDAETFVNDKRILETTILHHGMVIRFGKIHWYRFSDPHADKLIPPHLVPDKSMLKRPDMIQDHRGLPQDTENFETTFDVDGHIETKAQAGMHPDRPDARQEDLLPCSLQYKEEGEEVFLSRVIHEVSGNNIQFKLAPTYTLYMALRYRVRKLKRMEMSPNERSHWINAFTSKIVHSVQITIQESGGNAPALSFWMANTSELLHFLKQDYEVCTDTKPCQDQLAQAVQTAFHQLVDCMQADLHHVMIAFLDESMEDLQAESEMRGYPRGKATIGDVLQVLSSAMSLLRRCRVNAALTIQLFSQLFHFINMWLFNKLVLEPKLRLCTAAWGHRLKRRLGRVEIWAEKHGLELAADCHLARIIQASHLLEAPKGNPDDIANISSTCFKLNSLQLRALLEFYIPSPGEPHIPPELLARVIAVAQSMSDELLRSEGREVRLEENPDLQLPFLLPEDGYSCDIVKGVPNGLPDFLSPVTSTGLSQLIINSSASGSWTVYMGAQPMDGVREGPQQGHMPFGGPDQLPLNMPNQPEIVKVTFNKVKGSIGLSIVAAKGENQPERGIYVKSVVGGGGASQDGRLQAGDQLLSVDGHSLIGLTQEKAAEYMMHTGQNVTLEVAKQGAIYHGLTSLLSQPSPVMGRAPAPSPGAQKPRPRSEDINKLGVGVPDQRHRDQNMDTVDRQRPLQMQYGARSSPNVQAGDPQQQQRYHDYNGPYQQNRPPVQQPQQPPQVYKQMPPNQPNLNQVRSKSTTHLEYKEPMEHQPQYPPPQEHAKYQSHPDLARVERDKTYENYPMDRNRPAQYGAPRGMPPDDREMRQAKSMGNIRQPDVGQMAGDNRLRSGEFDNRQMQQWQYEQNKQQGNHAKPDARPGDIPLNQAKNSQYQNSFYQNTQAANPSNITLEQLRLSESRPRYSPEKSTNPPQPVHTSHPNISLPHEVPRVDVDQYKSQQGFYNPQRQQPAQQRPSPKPLDERFRGSVSTSDMHQTRMPSTPSSGGYPYQRKENSPDLPPPPPAVLPPLDDSDLPPPPVHVGEPERQLRHQTSMDPMMQQSAMRGNSSVPSYPGNKPSPQPMNNSGNYYNYEQRNPSRPQSESHPTNVGYHYTPRPAPAQTVDRKINDIQQSIGPNIAVRFQAPVQPPIAKKPPPVAVKPPPPPAKPSAKPDSSPWGREQKEKEKLLREQEVRVMRQREILELQSRSGLRPEEEERLKRLCLDEEFDRRVREASDKKDDDGDDSDTDMSPSTMGRTQIIDMMQRDVERRNQQKLAQEKKERADAEMQERQERRLAQFQLEREEQKRVQMMQQEKKARETEEYLNKQRELRERQHLEFEEQKRRQKQEEERMLENQREELRKKKEMEEEQMREIQAVREEEERQYRDSQRRYEEKNSYKTGPPAPPERRSSKDMYNNRLSHLPNLSQGDEYDLQMRGPTSAAPIPQQPYDMYSKKSVSFNTNLTQDMKRGQQNSEMRYGEYSQSTQEQSMHEYQSQPPPSQPAPQQQMSQRSSYTPSTPAYGYGLDTTPRNNQTPQNSATNTPVSNTPGVIGAQEVYRDPRDRITATKTNNNSGYNEPQRMSFRDKMKMFAKEAGENTPQDRVKISKAQQELEAQYQ